MNWLEVARQMPRRHRPQPPVRRPTRTRSGWLLLISCAIVWILATPLPGPSRAPSTAVRALEFLPHHSSAPRSTTATTGAGMTWFNETNRFGPSPRELAAIAYDPTDGLTLLFGGGEHRNSISYSDTWAYANGVWTQLYPSPAPVGRMGAGLVYDAHDGYMVLFGGYNESSGSFLSDTWRFSGGQWTPISTGASPSPRWLFGMDYDSAGQEVVLFGGGAFAPVGGTWTFSNGNWTAVSTDPVPPWRSDGAMAYDASDGVSVLYGGNANGSFLGDTWVFASGHWAQRTATPTPPPSIDFGLAYDPLIPAVILASGGVNSPSTTPQTWSYAHGGWKNLSGSLGSSYDFRTHQTLAWDGLDRYLLQFGGIDSGGFLSDSWAFDYLNATGAPLNTTAEAPFYLIVNASIVGGIPPVAVRWNLSNGAALPGPNGTLPVLLGGTYDLSLLVTDAAGAFESTGPFVIQALAAVTLEASAAPSTGIAPLTVRVTATASDGVPPYVYNWSFGDGTNGTGANLTHEYAVYGSYGLWAHVVDGAHHSALRMVTVTVEQVHQPPLQPAPSSGLGGVPLWLLGLVAAVAVVAAVVGLLLLRRSRRPAGGSGNPPSPTVPPPPDRVP